MTQRHPGTAGNEPGGHGGPAGRNRKPGAAPDPADGGAPLPGEENHLRELLRGSVDGLEPSADALERLRHAVPARRRRRRRAVAAAGGAALIAVGTPVMLHAVPGGGSSARTMETGHGQEAGGTSGVEETGDGPGTHDSGGTGVGPGGSPGATAAPEPTPEDTAEAETSAPEDSETLAGTPPDCTRDQLGDAAAEVAEPDERGHVYGSVRVFNVSADSCQITGTGELAVVPLGDAPADGVQVVTRTGGDRATGLPLPDAWAEKLMLLPGQAYEVRFAWVPGEGVTNGGCPVDPAPTSSASPDVGGTTAGTADEQTDAADAETGGGGDTAGSGGAGGPEETPKPDAPAPDGTALRYTPAAGTPEAARLELAGACTGTVYRTGALPYAAPAEGE